MMKRLKSIIIQLLHPPTVWILILVPFSAAAVILAFATGGETAPPDYLSYVLSAYALTVLIINFRAIIEKTGEYIRAGKTWKRMKAFLYRHPYSRRYLTDLSYRVRISLFISLAGNLLYAVFKLTAGIYYASFWYGADAIYYMVMSVARITLIRNMQKRENDILKEYRIYRSCGIFMLILNVALIGVVYQIINQNMGYQYPGLLIYLVAAFAFFNITTAIVSAVRFRKLNSPMLSAVKAVNLAKALVAMFALQSAMFASFGEPGGSSERMMNIIFGSCLCMAVFIMAVFMIIRASRNLSKLVPKEL